MCEVCTDLKVASDTDEFRSIAEIATSGGSASGLTEGRRLSRRLQANGTEEQLTDILDGVKSLRAGQDDLQSQVRYSFRATRALPRFVSNPNKVY